MARELAAKIEKSEKQIASWKRQLAKAVEMAEEEAAAQAGDPRINDEPLSDDRIDRTMAERVTMDVDTTRMPVSVKVGAGRATRKHAGMKRLYQKGHTVTSIAAELKEGRPRVNSWFAVGDANRPIPRRHAEYLRDKYGIPLTVWARVAD